MLTWLVALKLDCTVQLGFPPVSMLVHRSSFRSLPLLGNRTQLLSAMFWFHATSKVTCGL